MATKYAPRTQTAAVARAKSFDGKKYRVGRCQAFVVVDVFGTGAVGDYDGDKAADAEDGWKKAVDHGTVVKVPSGLSAEARTAWIKKIPAGYMAYYTGGSQDNGHAATTLGAGKLFTTDKTPGVCGIVDVTWPETHWGLKFVGYATKDGNGFTLTDRSSTAAKPPVAVWGKPETFILGATGADVTRLGERLVIWAKALNLPAPYRSGPGPTFTATDQAAVKVFQKAQGWTGADADGYPGAETFKILATDPPQPPTAKTFRLMLWNTKAPELTITGVHKWVGRRLGVVARIKQVNPTVLGMIESGSGSNLTWYKAALKVLGLTWAQHGAKWQNTWFSEDAKLVTSGLHSLPNDILLNGDNKELDWSILNIDGLEWIIGVGHPENENGTDKKSKKTGEQLRQLQVENYLDFLDKTAAARAKAIPQRRRVLVIDGNSPTGGVKRWVHGHTHYRDVFDLAAKTAGKNLRTNNKWAQSLAVIPGVQERIDLILIGGNYESTSLPPQVAYAGNHDQHKLSDHNDVYVDIVNQ